MGRPQTLRDAPRGSADGGNSKSKDKGVGEKKAEILFWLVRPHVNLSFLLCSVHVGTSSSHSFLHGQGKLDGVPSGKQISFLYPSEALQRI